MLDFDEQRIKKAKEINEELMLNGIENCLQKARVVNESFVFINHITICFRNQK